MARTSAALGVASERPKNTPRALVCQSGERSPIMYGRKMTPLAARLDLRPPAA